CIEQEAFVRQQTQEKQAAAEQLLPFATAVQVIGEQRDRNHCQREAGRKRPGICGDEIVLPSSLRRDERDDERQEGKRTATRDLPGQVGKRREITQQANHLNGLEIDEA